MQFDILAFLSIIKCEKGEIIMVDKKETMKSVEKNIGTNKLSSLTGNYDYSNMVWDEPNLIIDSINGYEEKVEKAKKRNIIRKILIGISVLGLFTTLGLAETEKMGVYSAAIIGVLCFLSAGSFGQKVEDEDAEIFEMKSYLKTAIDYIISYYPGLKDKINSQNKNGKVKKLNNNINK